MGNLDHRKKPEPFRLGGYLLLILLFCSVLPKCLFTWIPIQSLLHISSTYANSVTCALLPNLIGNNVGKGLDAGKD